MSNYFFRHVLEIDQIMLAEEKKFGPVLKWEPVAYYNVSDVKEVWQVSDGGSKISCQVILNDGETLVVRVLKERRDSKGLVMESPAALLVEVFASVCC